MSRLGVQKRGGGMGCEATSWSMGGGAEGEQMQEETLGRDGGGGGRINWQGVIRES